MNETMGILVKYGQILGLSAHEMAEIALKAQSAAEEFKAAPPIEGVLAASCGRDPKTLWLGAVGFGYLINCCTLVDTEEGDEL